MNKVIIKFGETFDKIERDILPRFGIRANARRCGGVAIPGCKVMIWWPNPFNHDKWVDECIHSKENRNECMVITEHHIDPVENQRSIDDIIANGPHIRFVFCRERWYNKRAMRFCGRSWLRAYGVYELDVEDSRKVGKLVWRRVAKDIELDLAGSYAGGQLAA